MGTEYDGFPASHFQDTTCVRATINKNDLFVLPGSTSTSSLRSTIVLVPGIRAAVPKSSRTS
jgi:hypothetical protein